MIKILVIVFIIYVLFRVVDGNNLVLKSWDKKKVDGKRKHPDDEYIDYEEIK